MRSLFAAALLALAPAIPADYTICTPHDNGPIVKQTPSPQFGRKPDMAATKPAPDPCPAPVLVPKSVTAPNSTFYSDSEPPSRFAKIPNITLQVRFGQDAIGDLCGRPPCGMVFLGCTRGPQMALPDPFSMDSAQFAKIVRHELSHVNGWPATHGD